MQLPVFTPRDFLALDKTLIRWTVGSLPELILLLASVATMIRLVFAGQIDIWLIAALVVGALATAFTRGITSFRQHRPDSDPWWAFQDYLKATPRQGLMYVLLTYPLLVTYLVTMIWQALLPPDHELKWRLLAISMVVAYGKFCVVLLWSRVTVLRFHRWLKGFYAPLGPVKIQM